MLRNHSRRRRYTARPSLQYLQYRAILPEHMETISHERNNEEAWICACGNTPTADGFYPCDELGNEMEPVVGSDWKGLYVCARCGRIINQETREVVGLK